MTPNNTRISGGTTKAYNYQATTLTCSADLSAYASSPVMPTKYYQFGYSATSGGTITWVGSLSTTNTYSVTKTAFLGTRYYYCRSAASFDGSTFSDYDVSSSTTMALVEQRIDFVANGGTISGTTPLYSRYGTSNLYSGRTSNTTSSAPTASKSGQTFEGWYSENGLLVINSSGTVQLSVTGWTDANGWLLKSTSNTENTYRLYAHYSVPTNSSAGKPNSVSISGGTTKAYNYTATTLTCSGSLAAYGSSPVPVAGYYEFGYATSSANYTSGTIIWSGNISTENTWTVEKNQFVGTRYYGCRMYANVNNGAVWSEPVIASTSTTMSLVNIRVDFDATTNGGTISGTTPLYARYGTASVYTSRTGSTTETIPTATKSSNTFKGWYTAASGGTQVINASGTLQASVSGWTNSSSKWLLTNTSTTQNTNRLYAQFTSSKSMSIEDNLEDLSSLSNTRSLAKNASTMSGKITTVNEVDSEIVSSTDYFLDTDIYRGEIKSIKFENNINAKGKSYDISSKKDGSVMLWITNEKDGYYDISIGQVGGVIASPNSSYLFSYLTSLESIDFTYFDTTYITDMSGMFYGCESLESIEFNKIIPENVVNLALMVSDCDMLSNDSINDLLLSVSTLDNVASNKTLKGLGLSEVQADNSTNLSNYKKFTDSGWSSGY